MESVARIETRDRGARPDLQGEGPAAEDLRGSVAAEMERIFAPVPRVATLTGDTAEHAVKTAPTPRRRGRVWRWIVGLLLVAILVIAGAAAFLAGDLAQNQPRKSRWNLRLPELNVTAPNVLQPPQVSKPPSPPPAPVETAPLANSPTQLAPPADVRPSMEVVPSPAPDAPKPATVSNRLARSERRSAPHIAARKASPVIQSPARARCPVGATEAWCLHGEVVAADDRLRDAYAAATRAGVDRTILVNARNDWSRLRRRANKDPRALIQGYADLTEMLRHETRLAAR